MADTLSIHVGTVELCATLLEFRAKSLSTSTRSPGASALREAAADLRSLLLVKPRNDT